MAEALLISRADIVKHTAMNGNIDSDKFIQFILIAQSIHIEAYTGTNLLNKLKADIVASTLAGNYITLVNTYLKPMLIHWAMVEYLPFAAYMIANGGIYKKGAENSEVASKSEVDFLIEKERSIAESYSSRFDSYMTYNQALFPEYTSNSSDDIYPKHSTNLGGWKL
jgi:hypothetical protein